MTTLRLLHSCDEKESLIAMLTSWANVLPLKRSNQSVDKQFWLGANDRFDLWVLFVYPDNKSDIAPEARYAVACLVCPEEKNVPAIGNALVAAYESSNGRGGIVPIGSIEIPSFPPMRRVADLGDMFPAQWSRIPAKLEPSFELSAGQGVTRELFEKFDCLDFAAATRVVQKPRISGLLIRFALKATADVAPLLPFVVDRPLRGGKRCTPERRDREEWGLMCMLYQHVRRRVGFGGEPAHYDDHSIRLVVAGRTAEECEQNWTQIVKGLRDIDSRAG